MGACGYALVGVVHHSAAPTPKAAPSPTPITGRTNTANTLKPETPTKSTPQAPSLAPHLPSSATTTPPPTGATGVCNDGSYTTATNKSEACLKNGGLYYWAGVLSTDTYTNVHGNQVSGPGYNPSGATAMCVDGTFSHSQDAEGTCSSHGGVDHYIGASTTQPAVSCDTNQEAVYQNQYTSAVQQENQRHTNALASIQSDYQSRGLGFSGLYQNAVDTENSQNQQNLANLQTQLNTELTGIHCP
jgi:hypothetical protein